MPAPEALAEIGRAVGAGGLEEHEPFDLDGVPIGVTLRPADGDALASSLEALGRLGIPAVVRGGGSRLGLGNPPRGAPVFLSTLKLSGIGALDPGEGVCQVAAGTRLSSLREAAADAGWELPLDPPGEGATVGGALAAAAVGPRALGYGLPRDLVLGLQVVLASGQRTRCGGRVVKNVTGYDLNKLYVGSLGTLGVIESAWLRLRPRPQRVAVLAADPGAAFAAGLAAARRQTARAVAVVAPPGGPPRLLVELAGDEPGVERDARWLARELGAGEAPPGALDRVRSLQGTLPDGSGLRFRVAARASRLVRLAGSLEDPQTTLLAYPGLSLLWVGVALGEGDAEAAARAFERVEGSAREAGGFAVLEQGPLAAKRGRDVFGGSPAAPLMRALKQRFDPAGLLAPGRFLGAC